MKFRGRPVLQNTYSNLSVSTSYLQITRFGGSAPFHLTTTVKITITNDAIHEALFIQLQSYAHTFFVKSFKEPGFQKAPIYLTISVGQIVKFAYIQCCLSSADKLTASKSFTLHHGELSLSRRVANGNKEKGCISVYYGFGAI